MHCSLPVMESMLGMIEESVKTSGSSVCREGKSMFNLSSGPSLEGVF